jgi:hypothetical protein
LGEDVRSKNINTEAEAMKTETQEEKAAIYKEAVDELLNPIMVVLNDSIYCKAVEEAFDAVEKLKRILNTVYMRLGDTQTQEQTE